MSHKDTKTLRDIFLFNFVIWCLGGCVEGGKNGRTACDYRYRGCDENL